MIFLTIVLLQRKDVKQKSVTHRSSLNEALLSVEIIDGKVSSVSDTKIKKFEQSSDDTRFAASVASYGMLLKDNLDSNQASYDLVLELANNALGPDKNGKRSEFINWVIQTREMLRK